MWGQEREVVGEPRSPALGVEWGCLPRNMTKSHRKPLLAGPENLPEALAGPGSASRP